MNRKRVLSFLVLGFFVLLFISFTSSFVSANGGNVYDPVVEMFTDWESGQLDVNIAKYLFTFLIFLLVYAIVGVIPFIGDGPAGKQNWIRIPFSLVVAFLGVAYLTTEEIYLMLLGYGALAMTIGTIIPFIVILFFTFEISKKGYGGLLISKIIWVAFAIFLGYKLVNGYVVLKVIGQIEFAIYVFFIVASLILVWKDREIHSFILKLRSKAGLLDHKDTLRAANMAGALQKRKEADTLEENGFKEEAEKLRKHADLLEKMVGKNY